MIKNITLFLGVIIMAALIADKVTAEETGKKMKINIQSNGINIVYELNGSNASKDLCNLLPLKIKVEDYGAKEKIFYPPERLNITDTPLASAKKGTLAYYAPWANVVMFYKDFGEGEGLYELGKVISGQDDIEKLSGVIDVTKHIKQE